MPTQSSESHGRDSYILCGQWWPRSHRNIGTWWTLQCRLRKKKREASWRRWDVSWDPERRQGSSSVLRQQSSRGWVLDGVTSTMGQVLTPISWLCPQLTVWPEPSPFAAPFLSFPLCKMKNSLSTLLGEFWKFRFPSSTALSQFYISGNGPAPFCPSLGSTVCLMYPGTWGL